LQVRVLPGSPLNLKNLDESGVGPVKTDCSGKCSGSKYCSARLAGACRLHTVPASRITVSKLRTYPRTEATFIEPMGCLATAELPDGPRWVWEILCGGPHKTSNVLQHIYGTLAASSGFDQQSMIALASSRTLDVAALVVEGLPTIRELGISVENFQGPYRGRDASGTMLLAR
jgi:hypothetical protein